MTDYRHQCVMDALATFGESSQTAILSQLHEAGIKFTPEEFDIAKFCKVLSLYLDRWAEIIFGKIIDDICRRSGITLDELGLAERAARLDNSDLLIEMFLEMEASKLNEARLRP